jgi:hypothetical protein
MTDRERYGIQARLEGGIVPATQILIFFPTPRLGELRCHLPMFGEGIVPMIQYCLTH